MYGMRVLSARPGVIAGLVLAVATLDAAAALSKQQADLFSQKIAQIAAQAKQAAGTKASA